MKIPENHPDYKKRFLILEPEIVENLFNWHGGQFTPTYSLASTGLHNLVSPAMVEDAISELESVKRQVKSRKEKRDLGNLIGDLDAVVSYPQEHSAREAGMDIAEDEYEYSPNPGALAMRPNLEPLGGGWVVGAVLIAGLAAYLVYDAVKGKKEEKAATKACAIDPIKLNLWATTNGLVGVYLYGWKKPTPPTVPELVQAWPQVDALPSNQSVFVVLSDGSFWYYASEDTPPVRRDDLRAEYCAYAPPLTTYRTPGTAGTPATSEHFLLG